ncbi:MAG TPA: cupin domain-containing protein [Acidobacteriaceae bacterium]|jgi:mannose-6-phosphate isomerase-like protein (cupin superfamily)
MTFQFFHSTPENLSAVKIPAIGLELAVRLPPQASGQALTVIETVNAPGFGPPLHRHRETEVFRVLEGRYLFEIDGKRFEAGAGPRLIARLDVDRWRALQAGSGCE